MDAKYTKVTLIVIALALLPLAALFLLQQLTGSVIWMKEGESFDVFVSSGENAGLKNVKLYDVAGANNRTRLCGFLVNGEHIWIEEGHHNVMDGLKIYVQKVILVRDQLQDKDICRVAFVGTIITYVNTTNATEEPDEFIFYNMTNETSVDETPGVLAENLPTEQADYAAIANKPLQEKPESISLFKRILLWLEGIFIA